MFTRTSHSLSLHMSFFGDFLEAIGPADVFNHPFCPIVCVEVRVGALEYT